MAARSKRLQVVLELARLRERQAARELAERIRQAASHQQQQTQLQDYQQEYRQTFQQQAQQPQSIARLSNFRAFYSNLDQAIDTQQERLHLAQQQQQQARAQWQSRYARQQNLGELMQRLAAEEERERELKLQREMDDRYATQRAPFTD